MKEFKISKYNYGEYTNGLLKAIEQTILVCENKIAKLKLEDVEYNSFRQIQIDGELRAFNQIKVNLLNKRNKIIERHSEK